MPWARCLGDIQRCRKGVRNEYTLKVGLFFTCSGPEHGNMSQETGSCGPLAVVLHVLGLENATGGV